MKNFAINYLFNSNFIRSNPIRVQRFSTPNCIYKFSNTEEVLNGLNEKDYRVQCTQFMKDLGDVLDECSNQKITDVERTDGVIKVTISGSKTFVINRQVPNRQIWYSSPIRQYYTQKKFDQKLKYFLCYVSNSGPQRFNFDNKEQKWKNQKNEELQNLLFKEIDKS